MNKYLLSLLTCLSCSMAFGQRIQSKTQGPDLDTAPASNPVKILKGFNAGTALSDSFDETYVIPGNGVLPETTEYAIETIMSGDTSFQSTLSSTFETDGNSGSMRMLHWTFITGAASPGAMVTPGISIGSVCREEVHFDVFVPSVLHIEADALGYSAAGDENFISTHIHRSDWVVQNLQTSELIDNGQRYDSGEFDGNVTLEPGRYTLYALSDFVESFTDGFINQNTSPCLLTTINWEINPVQIDGGVTPANPDVFADSATIQWGFK